MDAPAPGVANGLAGAVDVGWYRSREPGDGRVLGPLGDPGDGLEVALGRDRKPRLDDVDAHLVEIVGDLELLLERHRGAGALLAVAQRGVEYEDAIPRCRPLSGAGTILSALCRIVAH